MSGQSRSLRLGVLASGGGRTLENLVELSREQRLPAEVVLVISNQQNAYALERAARHGIRSACLPIQTAGGSPKTAENIYGLLDELRVDLVLLAGYLARLPVQANWRGKIMNIHPALLPAFGGRGYYGHHVHEAVLAAGVKVSGCTVHFVDDEYDHGPIILQRTVPVEFDDTADELAARVFSEEQIAYPEAVRLFAEDRLTIDAGRVRILA